MSLNPGQRIILLVASASLAAMLSFPPWTNTFDETGTHSRWPAGYAFIATPPQREESHELFGVVLDTQRLLTQCGALIFLFAGISLIARR